MLRRAAVRRGCQWFSLFKGRSIEPEFVLSKRRCHWHHWPLQLLTCANKVFKKLGRQSETVVAWLTRFCRTCWFWCVRWFTQYSVVLVKWYITYTCKCTYLCAVLFWKQKQGISIQAAYKIPIISPMSTNTSFTWGGPLTVYQKKPGKATESSKNHWRVEYLPVTSRHQISLLEASSGGEVVTVQWPCNNTGGIPQGIPTRDLVASSWAMKKGTSCLGYTGDSTTQLSG